MTTQPRIRASKRLIRQLNERGEFLLDMLENPEYAHLLERHAAEWEAALEEVNFQLLLVDGGMTDDQILDAVVSRRAFLRSGK